MSFDELAADIRNSDDASRSLDLSKPIWVYGTGTFGRAVVRALQSKSAIVAGFVETTPRAESCLGLPVRTIAQAEHFNDDQIAVGIFNRETSYQSIQDIATRAGAKNLYWPFDYYHQIADEMGWRFWLSSALTVQSSVNRIRKAYDLMSDDRSRTLLSRIIKFRIGRDFDFASFTDTEEQYFCDLTLSFFEAKPLCYVDCGAFDGDSFTALQGKLNVRDAYLFEPDVTNYDALVKNVSAFDTSVKCLPLAVSDRYAILSFEGGGEGGAVKDIGTTQIAAVKLDDMFSNTEINFIKLDIEGSEIAALDGARKIIALNRPVICASLYHKPDDVWEIPLFISSIVDNYDYYIRQHMFNSFESVLYAVPRAH